MRRLVFPLAALALAAPASTGAQHDVQLAVAATLHEVAKPMSSGVLLSQGKSVGLGNVIITMTCPADTQPSGDGRACERKTGAERRRGAEVMVTY